MRIYDDSAKPSNKVQKTANDRTARVDLVQGIDVKSRSTMSSTARPFISVGDISVEPFTHAVRPEYLGSSGNSVVFDQYVDTYKPQSTQSLLDTDYVFYSTVARSPINNSIEPLDSVSLRFSAEKTKGFRTNLGFICGRFENEKVATSSAIMSNCRKVLDDTNFFGNVKYEGYIKEELNFETFNDDASQDLHKDFSTISVPRTKRIAIGGTGGSDITDIGPYTLLYAGLYR
jgi:hypothetical protein